MIIRVHKRESPYAVIDKQPLEDRQLSWKAKGILSYLLSKPDNWSPIIEELAKASSNSIDSVRSGLKELEYAGYLIRKKMRNGQGKIMGWEHIVFEKPQVEKPLVEKPQLEKPQLDFPHVGNPMLISNELNNNDLSNNDLNKNNGTPSGVGLFLPIEESKEEVSCSSKQDKEYSSDFLLFWQHYPRKKEKPKAWRVWKSRIKEKTPAGDMILAAEKYATECIGRDGNYIKLAATFLGPDKHFKEYLAGEGENGADNQPRDSGAGKQSKKFSRGIQEKSAVDWESEPDTL